MCLVKLINEAFWAQHFLCTIIIIFLSHTFNVLLQFYSYVLILLQFMVWVILGICSFHLSNLTFSIHRIPYNLISIRLVVMCSLLFLILVTCLLSFGSWLVQIKFCQFVHLFKESTFGFENFFLLSLYFLYHLYLLCWLQCSIDISEAQLTSGLAQVFYIFADILLCCYIHY